MKRQLVLDLTCAEGILSTPTMKKGVVGVVPPDIYREEFSIAEEWFPKMDLPAESVLVLAKAQHMHFIDDVFDATASNCVSDHIHTYAVELREDNRTMQEAGQCVGTVPSEEEDGHAPSSNVSIILV